MANEIVKNLHGHTTIKLTNVHTGEEKIIEDDNTITNYLDKLLNSAWPTIHPLGFRARGMFPFFRDSHVDFIKTLTQGVMCFDKTINENDEYNYLLPGNATCVACGTNTNNTESNEYGSYNSGESFFKDTDNEHYYEYVWDFTTNQANGKINSVCLTTIAGGRVGGGTLEWNSTFYQGYNRLASSTFQIGQNIGMEERSDNDLPYLPHPFSPGSLYGKFVYNVPGYSDYYPWYDLDNDVVIITNQTIADSLFSYGTEGSAYYYIRKGDNTYGCGENSWSGTLNYLYCHFFNSNWSGIQRPLILWKYHTKPKYWNIYSSYYKSSNTNDAFDEMFIEKKEIYLPDDIKQELVDSYSSCRDTIYKTYTPPKKYLSTTCYYANRIFASDNYLYQVFKPYALSETDILQWHIGEYIYVWKIPTDFSKEPEVIKVVNTTDISMYISDNYVKDQTSIFITDEYLFCWDINGVMWMYTFTGEEWIKIKDKNGNDCTYDIISGKRYFPQRTWYDYRSNILFIAGAGYANSDDNQFGTGGKVVIIRPLIAQAAILNTRGDIMVHTKYLSYYSESINHGWTSQGIYTHLKTNNKKMIFNLARISGSNGGSQVASYCQPFICSYNYSNPVLTTINNLPEEVEKTEDYTMKITYRISWDNP